MQRQLFESREEQRAHRSALKLAAVGLKAAYPKMTQRAIGAKIGVSEKQVSRFLIEHAQERAQQTPPWETSSAATVQPSNASGTAAQTASIIAHREIAADFEKAAHTMAEAAKGAEVSIAEIRIAAGNLADAATKLDGLLKNAFVQGVNTEKALARTSQPTQEQ